MEEWEENGLLGKANVSVIMCLYRFKFFQILYLFLNLNIYIISTLYKEFIRKQNVL